MGTELLHKGRLFRHDRMQVFKDPTTGTEAKLQSGDFMSVAPEKCIERLESRCSIVFTRDAKDAYERLRGLRNKVVHFAMPIPEEGLRSRAAEVLAVLVDFIDQHAAIVPGSPESELRERIYGGLANIKDWIAERLKAIEPETKAQGNNVFFCPVCDQRALVVRDDTRRCLFCFSEPTADEAAMSHARKALGFHPYEGLTEGWDPFGACPVCEDRTLLRVAADREGDVCFACGAHFDTGEIVSCMRCGRLFVPPSEEEDVICHACFDDVVGKD
ncbi:MAG TPA: hypothetical protein VF456_00050 [Vicinamibacterales bacterium]